jgi:ABC-type transport system involved in multi-copper enzyme maturation permease subunit
MFRALLWKEWRQLALVRWGGIALGALLPIAFTAGAELSKRGLIPTGDVKSYTPRDLMFEVLPAALALGLWPLMALMTAAQAFAADRSAGNESFLLERPVPRGTVWSARFAASLGTLALVMVVTAALGASVAALAGAPPALGWTRWLQWSGDGAAVALLAFLGGLIASSLLNSPMAAVLAGAMLAGIPVLVAAQLATGFMHASFGGMPLGAVLPVLMLPAYLAASWASSCRGEPAGRGRVKRGVAIVAGALLGVFALFFLSATIVVRANAAAGMHYVLASPTGQTAFVGSGGYGANGGWIVESASGSKRHFVAPPGGDFAWSPDGAHLAVVTWSGPFGSVKAHARIDILRADSGDVVRSVEVPGDRLVYGIAWAPGGIVVVDLHEPPGGRKGTEADVKVDIVDPVSGAWRDTGFNDGGWSKSIVGPLEDGSVFIRVPMYDDAPPSSQVSRGARAHPIDVGAAHVGEPLAGPDGKPWVFANGGPSPSGRYARVKGHGDDSAATRIVDLRSGEDLGPAPRLPSAQWVAGDRLIWLETLGHRSRLFVASPGRTPVALREWTDGQVGVLAQLDGSAVFVSAIPAGGAPAVDAAFGPTDPALFESTAPAAAVPSESVYLPEQNRWIDLPAFSDRPNDQRYSVWAGPKTLARIADGVVYFEDIDKPGEKRFVIGSERDLR